MLVLAGWVLESTDSRAKSADSSAVNTVGMESSADDPHWRLHYEHAQMCVFGI